MYDSESDGEGWDHEDLQLDYAEAGVALQQEEREMPEGDQVV